MHKNSNVHIFLMCFFSAVRVVFALDYLFRFFLGEERSTINEWMSNVTTKHIRMGDRNVVMQSSW